MEVDQLEVCSNSQLLVKQIEDTYKAKGEKNDPIPQKGTGITKEVRTSLVRHLPRAENSQADALAKLATSSQEDLNKLMPVEPLSEPSVDLNNEEVFPVMSKPS